MSNRNERGKVNAQPAEKVELHATAIVDPRPVPPRLFEIDRELLNALLWQIR